MSNNLLPSLKTYNLNPSMRRRFQTILDGLDENGDLHCFLKPYEKEILRSITADWLSALDTKQTQLRQVIHDLTGQSTNQQVEEDNRLKIYNAVQQHILKHKVMPGYQQVAHQTGISRQTVAKHISAQFSNSDEFIAQYNYAAKALMDMMLHEAVQRRSLFAATSYLSTLHKITSKAAPPLHITIGNSTLTQQIADSLTEEQQRAIEEIINGKPTLPQLQQTSQQ